MKPPSPNLRRYRRVKPQTFTELNSSSGENTIQNLWLWYRLINRTLSLSANSYKMQDFFFLVEKLILIHFLCNTFLPLVNHIFIYFHIHFSFLTHVYSFICIHSHIPVSTYVLSSQSLTNSWLSIPWSIMFSLVLFFTVFLSFDSPVHVFVHIF